MSDAKNHPMGGGMFGKDSQTIEVYLNLTPLMDVMSNILFFLLAAFGASAVSIFSVTVPVDATSDAPTDAPAEDKVSLTMRADASGITLGCQDPMKLPDELKVCNQKIPKTTQGYDVATLNGAIKGIKQRFPGANTVVFVPDDDIKYAVLVQILDAVRDFKQPDGKRLALFPDVVMSSLVQ